MGLTNSSSITTLQEEQESLIAFEFDTNFDLELGDINDNHVGLDINTIFSFASENANSVGVDLKAGRPMKGWVEYKNEDKLIRIWISYSRFRPSNPVLVTHVGFSASNRQGMALHLIDKSSCRTFRFKPNSVSSNNNNDNPVVDDDSGSVDMGEDNGDSLLAEQRRRSRKRELGFEGGTAEFLFSMAGIAVAGWYIVKKKRKNGMQSCRLEEIRRVPTRVSLPSRFSFSLKMRPSTSVFVILIILLLPRLSSLSLGSTQRTTITFVYSPSTNITLIGDAYMRNGAMSLTRELGPSISNSGRALYAHPIRFLDATTNAPASFSSYFSFSIFPSPSSPFGDGLAFIITSNPCTIGTSNGYMGLTNSSSITTIQEEQESLIAFEFDTNFDLELGDINDNHVGLDINTIFSFASENANSVGVDLKAGRPMKGWVEYKNEDKLVRVWISYSRFRPSNPVLVTHIDLSNTFHEFMYVGFSASNGQGMALHVIDKWSFRTFGFIPNSVSSKNDNDNPAVDNDRGSVDMGKDNGDSLLSERRRRRIRMTELGFAGGTAAFLFSMAGIAVAGWYIVKKRRNGTQSCRVEEIRRVPTRVSLTEIKAATRGFDCAKIIGEGASGTVYQGVLSSGNAVAVKRFGRMDKFTNTFATELEANLGCLRHKNLVQIQGWCCEKNEFLLLYEHMANGSLDKFLHPPPPPAPTPLILSWENRLKIVLGVASALSYLHYECEKQIIHRDVKACNIMLDAEFNAKLGDFGLAELKEHDISPQVTIPAGTMGYLAPEYVYSWVLSEKTDVYSFGVVALEVGTGKRPIDKERFVLVDWVWGMWGMGKLVEAADRQLEGRFNKEEMYRMLVVGLSCVHPDCNQRPNMPNAIRMLKGEAPLPLLPSHKPAAVRLLSLVHDDYKCQGDNSSLHRYHPPNSNTTNGGQRGGEIRGCTSPTHWFTPRTSF
ncbi:L-type lectin-domain containing receptor kinase S.6-like [Tasmannia lanceolata]|uniref:L-type lectin-domain containing receptor kinase S.6-like n=1 Tax=Tasmannia lanceolata TaxID=3420 RepID=UPI004063550D